MATTIEPSTLYADAAVLRNALTKIATIDAPKVTKIAVAFTGGLDSTLCIVLAQEKYGAEVVPIIVNVGQGEDEIAMAFANAKQFGITPILVDAKAEFTEQWLTKAIQANADESSYPVSVVMARQLIAQKVAKTAVDLGCDALMDAASGIGNDQYWTHNVFAVLAPDLKVLVPARDVDLTHAEKLAICEYWGVPVSAAISGGIEVDAIVPEAPQTLTLTFENGIPVALDGEAMPLDALITALNVIGGTHGIGTSNPDLTAGAISAAPAATIILTVHKDIESMMLTTQQLMFKQQLDATWASLVSQGEWFQPLKADLDAAIANTQSVVQGAWTVSLYNGTIEIIARQLAAPLFKPETHWIASTGLGEQFSSPAAYLAGLPDQTLASLDATMRTNETIAEELVAD